MAHYAGVCRLVWNLALEQRRNHWRQYQRQTGNNLNWVTQGRELTDLRREIEFIRDVPQAATQRVITTLDDTYKRAFKGACGFPQNKRKGVHDSFSFQARDIQIEKLNGKWGRVRIPKLGWVKFRRSRDVEGIVREVTFSRTALGWQVGIGSLIDREVADPGGAVGIDRGVAIPLALSDGQTFSLPPSVALGERRHRSAQRVVSRRKRGSARWGKAVRRAAKIKAQQARIRKHWAHQATTVIARSYGTIVVERLRTANMTASAAGTTSEPGRNVVQKRGLNRAILNVGWHQIERMLSYKAARLIKVDPRHTSQTCASCGTVDSLSRKSQARFDCTSCGHTDNADRNAAINILNRGNTPGVEPCHLAGAEARTLRAA